MKTADREDQDRLVAPADAQRHVAGQRVDEQVRIVETGVEPDQAFLEIDAAGEVDLQVQDRQIFRRQTGTQHARDHDRGCRQVDDHADLE